MMVTPETYRYLLPEGVEASNSCSLQRDNFGRAVGTSLLTESAKRWPAELPPKALWQILLNHYWKKTGSPLGDPQTTLWNPHDRTELRQYISHVRSTTGEEVWIGSATWSDPLYWDTKAKRPKLWKNVNEANWEQFTRELTVEQTQRKNLILKAFPQDPEFKVIKIRLNAGSLWNHPEGWSILVEWFEAADGRTEEKLIPRSFMISSHPEPIIICGKSTKKSAVELLTNNGDKLCNIVDFWGTIHHPPSVFECMRKNERIQHVNDIDLEIPNPAGPLEENLLEYEEKFIKPLYPHHQIPDIASFCSGELWYRWILPDLWSAYANNLNGLAFTSVNEGNPENSKARANTHYMLNQTINQIHTQPHILESC